MRLEKTRMTENKQKTPYFHCRASSKINETDAYSIHFSLENVETNIIY